MTKWSIFFFCLHKATHSTTTGCVPVKSLHCTETRILKADFLPGRLALDTRSIRWLVSGLINSVDISLLWEKNTIDWLISPDWTNKRTRWPYKVFCSRFIISKKREAGGVRYKQEAQKQIAAEATKGSFLITARVWFRLQVFSLSLYHIKSLDICIEY